MEQQEGATLYPSQMAAESRTKFARNMILFVWFLALMVCVTLYVVPPMAEAPTRYANLEDVVINDFEPYPVDGRPKVSLYNRRDYAISVEEYHLTITSPKTTPSFHTLSLTIPPFSFVTTAISPLSPTIQTTGGQLLFQDPSRERTLDSLTFAPLAQTPPPQPDQHQDDPSLYVRSDDKVGTQVGEVYYRDPSGGIWSETLESEFPAPRKDHSKPTIGTFSGEFEIHILDVGQGDSQLIVFPSGYSILIDVNEDHWQSSDGAEFVADRIQSILGSKHVNVGVISHLHLDHLGYAGKGGFWALLEKYGVTFDKIVDRDSGSWVDKDNNGLCDKNSEIVWKNAGTFSGTATGWLCYATDPKNDKIFPIREVGKLCSDKQIDPPDEEGHVRIVTIDGQGAVTEEGTPIGGDHTQEPLPPSENDYSIGLLVKFGDFTYITCGDLDGEYATATYGYTYNNIEKVVADRVGQVDVYHLNHHGSGHSSSSKWLEKIKPKVSIGSCGVANSYGHPDQGTIDRVEEYGDLYVTSDCDLTHNYHDAIRANSDVVLKSKDGSSYTVAAGAHTKTYDSKKNNRPMPECP